MTNFLILAIACTALQDATAKETALTGLDPVALCQGREVAGKPSFELRHGPHTYRFESAQSLATFQKDPVRWGIQFDGACMKMGPLSGAGSAGRFAVHEGRIYLFASDSCYQWFVLDPTRYVDREDEWVKPDAAQITEGRAALGRAASFLGGAKAIQGITSLQTKMHSVSAEDRKKIAYTLTKTWSKEGDFLRHYEYEGGYVWADLHSKGNAYSLSKEVQRLGPQTRAYLLRYASHEPVILVRDVLAGKAQVAALGKCSDRAGSYTRVRVYRDGSQTILSIDDLDGRIRSAENVGRGSGPGIGVIVWQFSEYRFIEGVAFPSEVHTVFNGQPVKDSLLIVAEAKVNPILPDGFFDPKAVSGT